MSDPNIQTVNVFEENAALRAQLAESQACAAVLAEAARLFERSATEHDGSADECEFCENYRKAETLIKDLPTFAQAHLARVAAMEEALTILGFDTEQDAHHNLGGAIIDIEKAVDFRLRAIDRICDPVSLRTLKRVEAQLGKVAALSSSAREGE